MPQAHSDVQIDNDHFRVTKWTIEPGAVVEVERIA